MPLWKEKGSCHEELKYCYEFWVFQFKIKCNNHIQLIVTHFNPQSFYIEPLLGTSVSLVSASLPSTFDYIVKSWRQWYIVLYLPLQVILLWDAAGSHMTVQVVHVLLCNCAIFSGDTDVPWLSSRGYAPSHIRRRSDGLPQPASVSPWPVDCADGSQWKWKDNQCTTCHAVLPCLSWLCRRCRLWWVGAVISFAGFVFHWCGSVKNN